jgi:hypothetical protein
MCQLMKNADFSQGKVALMEPLMKRASMTRVEAVETPHCVHGPARINTAHALLSLGVFVIRLVANPN